MIKIIKTRSAWDSYSVKSVGSFAELSFDKENSDCANVPLLAFCRL